jgi:predicted dehydrogenase
MSHRSLSRRGLLKGSAGLAAGFAAPTLWLPAHAQSAAGRLAVASIGVGGRGTAIGNQAAGQGKTLACADVHRGNAERFAKRHKCEVFTDYRKVLERKDIDVITCGTTDHWHVKVAIDAMKAGKDVYCEKPLTLTIDESRMICEAATKTKRIFQVGTQQRSEYGNKFLKAVAIAKSGRLGKKLNATVSTGGARKGGPFPEEDPPKELDWDFYLGQAPVVPFNKKRIGFDFRWWLEYSGGQVTDWGVHHMDIALWALGGDETGIAEISGKGDFPAHVWGDVKPLDFLNGRAKLPPAYNVTPSYNCDIKLPNGAGIKFVSGRNLLTIEGENGKIEVNRGKLAGDPVKAIEGSEKDKQWLEEEIRKLYRGMPMKGHMANFFHCVKTRQKPISDVWTHTNSVNTCHMANIAMLLKRPLKWDQKQYRFVGDDEANKFLKREQRKGYEITL